MFAAVLVSARRGADCGGHADTWTSVKIIRRQPRGREVEVALPTHRLPVTSSRKTRVAAAVLDLRGSSARRALALARRRRRRRSAADASRRSRGVSSR